MKIINKKEMSITHADEELSLIKKVYGEYLSSQDMTIIFEDVINKENGMLISTEIKGFYYGDPSIENIEQYQHGELKAKFD